MYKPINDFFVTEKNGLVYVIASTDGMGVVVYRMLGFKSKGEKILDFIGKFGTVDDIP